MKIKPPGRRMVLTHLCTSTEEVGQALHAMYSRLDQMHYDVCFMGHGSPKGMIANVNEKGVPKEQQVVPLFFVTATGLGRTVTPQGTEKESRGGHPKRIY